MSEVKPERQSSGRDKPLASAAAKDAVGCDVQREDLRLDCLRLAAQRQGARDSRGLLEIAEEYYGWVTAESGARGVAGAAPQIAPDVIDGPSVQAAPVQRSSTRLSLGAKPSAALPKAKRGAKRSRPDSSG